MSATRTIGVVGGHGRTGRAVVAALESRGAEVVVTGREDWDDLAETLAGCVAVYVIAPNLHDDEPGYVEHVLDAAGAAGVERVVYHSVASPHAPAMPHHLDKAEAEDALRRSGLAWTVLQPGPYLQNLDLTQTVRLPYRADAPFGFLDLADLGEAAATVLLEDRHAGATYELATRQSTVAELADEAGVDVVVEPHTARPSSRADAVRRAMFAYYDDHGLLVGTHVLDSLLGRTGE